MHRACVFIACALIATVAANVAAQDSFNMVQCRQDCSFRYGIQRDYGGMIKLPSNSLRWEGYQKCVDECDRKSWEKSFGNTGD